MTTKEKKERIKQELQYLIAEGFVVEGPKGMYRLKTQKELDKELNELAS
jgi:hypothetical protein